MQLLLFLFPALAYSHAGIHQRRDNVDTILRALQARSLLDRRQVTPDGTCGLMAAGNGKGYICTTVENKCCSYKGYCGDTVDHCGNGCQSGYGNCSAPSTAGTDDKTCGPLYGNKVCVDKLDCCSPAGFCGKTQDYCKSPDCLSDFGNCDSKVIPQGANLTSIARPKLGSLAYGIDLYSCNTPGDFAMTYDDGPFNYTVDVLDVFKKYNASATFFLTGINNGKGAIDDPTKPWPAAIKRMWAEGHQIASHTWSHADLSKLAEYDRVNEMVKLEMALRNIIGVWPTYMRPPYSSCNDACHKTMETLGYHITYFELDTDDYQRNTPDLIQGAKDIVAGNLSAADPGKDDFLAIGHDIIEQTAHNLTDFILSTLKEKGFTAVTVGECLGDSPENWYRSPDGKVVSPPQPPRPTRVNNPSRTTNAASPTSKPPNAATGGSETTAAPSSTVSKASGARIEAVGSGVMGVLLAAMAGFV